MDELQARIHKEHPFHTPPELREPVRRLRGRLASPVTIWTSGREGAYAGLTVSSIVVAEGEPSRLVGLVGPLTDLWDALEATAAFVVHLLPENERALADRFAGQRPSPGGLFAGLAVTASEWGPVLTDLTDRAYCRMTGWTEPGFQRLVSGVIERIELAELDDPLVYFRGRYRRLASDD
ncbi:MAG: flavin reductase family protein [Actinomycetota bacterium]